MFWFGPSTGAVTLNGRPVAGLSPARISQAGPARSFRITSLFVSIPIRENLRLSFQVWHPGRFNLWRDIDR